MPLNTSQVAQLELSIREFLDSLYDDYVDTLTKLVKTSFDDGIRSAERSMKSKMTHDRKQEIYDNIPETIAYVENRITPAFDTMYNTLTNLLEQCIKNRLELSETKDLLMDKISYLENNLPFNSVGKIINTSAVIDGIIIPGKKTITRKHTMKIDDYFDYISKDVGKMAYLQSKVNGFVLKGYTRFKYNSKNERRTRPEHLALHNKIFNIGSHDADLVLLEMLKPNCRCDISPEL